MPHKKGRQCYSSRHRFSTRLPRAAAIAGQLRACGMNHAARQSGFSPRRRFPARGVRPGQPAQPDLCRDFFRRLYPSNSLSSKPPIPTGLDTILPAAYTISQSQRTALPSMTSNYRQRARVAQENDHPARHFYPNSDRREISLSAGDCVEWVTTSDSTKIPVARQSRRICVHAP